MIRFGSSDDMYEAAAEIKSNDRLFYKIFNTIRQDDEKAAIQFVRDRYGFAMMDSKRVIHMVKEKYSEQQIDGLLKWIYDNEPEYVL